MAKDADPERVVIECLKHAKKLYDDSAWNQWADAWLSGRDRSWRSAMEAAERAFDASEIDPEDAVQHRGRLAVPLSSLGRTAGAIAAWSVSSAAAHLAGSPEGHQEAARLALVGVASATMMVLQGADNSSE